MKISFIKKVADIVLKAAKSAAGSASDWYSYQPKEPQKLKEMMSK